MLVNGQKSLRLLASESLARCSWRQYCRVLGMEPEFMYGKDPLVCRVPDPDVVRSRVHRGRSRRCPRHGTIFGKPFGRVETVCSRTITGTTLAAALEC